MAKHSRKHCMHCRKSPARVYIWAGGRARAWFCKEHGKKFASEHKGDIIRSYSARNGVISAR